MQFIIVLSMIFAMFIAVFALQNSSVITINLLWYKLNLSQAVVILGSALIGILVMVPFDVARRIRNSLKIAELKNKIKNMEQELSILKNNEEPDAVDEITKIEDEIKLE